MPVHDQHVFPPVQVHIEECSGPGPFGSGQAGQVSDFRIRAISPVEKQSIPHVLRPVRNFPDLQDRVHAVAHLRHALDVVPAEHIQHQEIIVPIPINVGKIHAHGKQAALALRQSRQGPKLHPALVQPDPVLLIEVVADVNIRQTVLIDVPNHHRQTPVIQWRRQRLPFFIEKGPAGKADRLPVCPSDVPIKRIHLPVLIHPAARINTEPPHQVRLGYGPSIHSHDDLFAVHHFERELGVRHVHKARSPVIRHVEVQKTVSVHITQREGHAPLPGV